MHIRKNCSNFAADFALMSEHAHNIVDLQRLQIGVHRFDIQLDDDFFASLEKTEVLGGQVAATVTLNLREDFYTLDIAVHGTVRVVCDRCLDMMEITIEDEQEVDSEDEEMGSEDMNPNDKSLDLTWLVYEIVSINIPLVHCHPEGGCNPQMDLLLQRHLCDEPEPEN